MLTLILSLFLTVTVLGNEDYQLTPLDPRIVAPQPQPQQLEDQLENNILTLQYSPSVIDFGIIRPTNPVLRQQTLQVVSSSNNPFAVVVWEDHSLRRENSNDIIADTTCDNGACRETVGAAWDNPLAYGFGYSLGNFFKQFTSDEAGETKLIITNGTKELQSTINYKVNVAKTQPGGIYSNTINYVVIPNY